MTARHFEFSLFGVVVIAMAVDGQLFAGASSSLALGQLGKLGDALRCGGALPHGWRELSPAELESLESLP